MHHEKQLAEMIYETLKRLNLEYKKYKDEYSREELDLMIDVMLGIHLRNDYTTLCETCHNEIHATEQKIKKFLMPPKEEIVIPNCDVIVYLTSKNRIYKSDINIYRDQRLGGRGYFLNMDEDEYLIDIGVFNSLSRVTIISANGKVKSKYVYEIPYSAEEKYIENENCIKLMDFNLIDDDKYIVISTVLGMGKRMLVNDIVWNRNVWTICCTLKEGDYIKSVNITDKSSNIFCATDNGNVIRFNNNDARAMGRISMGVKFVEVDKINGVSIGSYVFDEEIYKNKYFISITEKGYIKRTSEYEYKSQFRGGFGCLTHKISNITGKLVSCCIANDNDILAVWNSEHIIFIRSNDIPLMSKSARGQISIRLDDNDDVRGMIRVNKNGFIEERINIKQGDD